MMTDNHLDIAERYQSCQTEEELEQIQWINIDRYFDTAITGTLINFDPGHYQYMNDNPLHDIAVQHEDYLYQALSVLLPDKKPVDIINIILHEQITNGIQQIYGRFADFVIKKYVKMTKIKIPKNSTIQDLFDHYHEWLPKDTFLMIRLTGRYEFFNTANGKIYSHNLISNREHVWHACTWEVRPQNTDNKYDNIIEIDETKSLVAQPDAALETIKHDRIAPGALIFDFIDPDDHSIYHIRYKNLENFHMYNNTGSEHFRLANANPAKRNTEDTLFRGLAIFLDISWEEVAILNLQCYLTIGKFLDTRIHGEYAACEYLRNLGFIDVIETAFNRSKHPEWMNNCSNPRGNAFADIEYLFDTYPVLGEGRCLMFNGSFVTPVVDGKMLDTWDYTTCSFTHYLFVNPNHPIVDAIEFDDIDISSYKVKNWLNKRVEAKERELLKTSKDRRGLKIDYIEGGDSDK